MKDAKSVDGFLLPVDLESDRMMSQTCQVLYSIKLVAGLQSHLFQDGFLQDTGNSEATLWFTNEKAKCLLAISKDK